MKTNRMTQYAFQIIETMFNGNNIIITSKCLANRTNISQGVLIKVLARLKKAGIVESHQGRGEICGGFTLKNSIKNLSIYDLLVIMEGGFILCQCTEEDNLDQNNIVLHKKLLQMNNMIIDELGKCSIYDILMQSKGGLAPEFSIL